MAAPVAHASQATVGSVSAGSGSFTVNYPASVAEGNLLLLTVTSWTTVTPSAPSGWTQITATSHTYHRTATYWREAPSSPGTSVALPYSASGGGQIIANVTRITGHKAGAPIDAWGSNAGSAMPCNAPSLTPLGAERLSVVAGSWVTDVVKTTAPSASGYTVTAQSTSGNLKGAVATKTLTSTAATGTVDFNFGAHHVYAHTHVLIAPETAVPITMGTIASGAVVYAPTSVLLNTRPIEVGSLGPTATVPEQRIQPGDEYITLPEWAATSGTELDYRNDEDYRSGEDYRPSGLVVGTRVFPPGIVLDAVGISPGHISGTALFEPGIEAADRTVTLEHLTSGAVHTPGVTDGQSFDLGGLSALAESSTVYELTIVAGEATLGLELIATTELFAPSAFDFGIDLPTIESTTTVFDQGLGYTIEVPLLASTRVFTPLIGQYLVIPEPDEVVWGASGGFSARVDILDPGGHVVASTATAASGIVLVSGTVNEDISQAVTRECSVRMLLENTPDGSRHPLLPARPGDPLDPRTGGALAIYAGPIRPSGEPALVKLGVFRITAASPTSTATGESLDIRGLSEETVISATPFFDVFSVSAGTPFTQVIGDMVTQALPNVRIHAESTGITAPQFSFADSDNRLQKVQELANAIGMVARFDRDGRFRIEHAPEYGDTAFVSPQWTFAEGAGAVMRDVSRELDDSELFNGVIVVGEPLDTNTAPVRAVLWDTRPDSPVYYNPNNPGASRMGPRPKKVVSSLVYTAEQAQAMAIVLLTRLLAYPDRISVSVAANPNIEAGDLARIVRTTMGVDGLYEVRSITHDLLGGESKAICVARV